MPDINSLASLIRAAAPDAEVYAPFQSSLVKTRSWWVKGLSSQEADHVAALLPRWRCCYYPTSRMMMCSPE